MTTEERKEEMYYNQHTKERFLNKFPENTQTTYSRVFKFSKDTEAVLGKDLYDFNLDEIESVLYDLMPRTKVSSHSNGRVVTSYITWAIEQGLRKNNINPLKVVGADYFHKFVDENVNLFFTDKEIAQVEDGCTNAQDAVIFRLAFEGVGGKKHSEMRNLKRQDVDYENNVLLLKDEDESERSHKVSDRCIHLIEQANRQRIYYKRNGEMMETANNIRNYADLVENDYVLRTALTRSSNYDKVDISLIFRRVSAIAEIFDIPYLNVTNITKSGMLFMAKQLVERDGELTMKQYREIAARYKINNPYSIKNYITMDAIRRVYGEE